ncbi:MAG TPA: glycosyltransferase family 9 protein [Bryobacteraceae bacterium]|nr:glycosyltransferase family 9 protein [Bryobacteraceae bacterium]
MANIWCNERAERLLERCLAGAEWPEGWLEAMTAEDCAEAFFRVVVEGLADRFEPALCETYAALFSRVIEAAAPGVTAAGLTARYQRVRRPRPVCGAPEQVYVLSRVTLGADVAVTSVLLDAAKRRFPEAQIWLVGARKNWELFAADARIRHLPAAYQRGSLRDRLASWPELQQALSQPRSIVIDPDSRLTQLGLLPVCPEENYYFFESRGYGGAGEDPLPELARRWAEETFGVADARPYVAPAPQGLPAAEVTISLGVGENPAKRIADPFEEELLRYLAGKGSRICIDRGAGGEEAERVERAIARSGARVERWEGSFAGFADRIARSSLYVGYDSAGQHVAAACGVPLVSIFAGFPCARMFARWRPAGSGRIDVVRVDDPVPAAVLRQVMRALE